ncbi:sulfate transporter [Aplysia californica]|uniref:Sulfate transporter n=1 Tax=Aplysia californica TaxID=6500 RepID=A0ABM0K131_APLCA|nr:sulfate transporter [Aplysia californica]
MDPEANGGNPAQPANAHAIHESPSKKSLPDHVIESRDRSASTWTTRSTLVSVNRPIYQTRTVRDKYLKIEEKNKSLKDTVRRKIKDSCQCNRDRWKKGALSVFPFIRILRKYQWRSDLPNDIVSGLTVGIMQLPQGMAYAMLADLPPVVGLYMSFFPVIIYFFFGTSKQISMGTVAVVSLMTGGIVAAQTSAWRVDNGIDEAAAAGNLTDDWIDREMAFKISIAATVSFITGLAQVGMGLLHVGFVTTYMGDSLVSGFTTGAAVHVFTSQVKYVFGLKIKRFPNLFQIINTYVAIFENIPDTNVATLILSVICMIILYIVKVHVNMRYKTKLKMPVPIELIVVVASTLASHYGEFHDRWGIKVVGKIPAGLPEPALPAFTNVSQYGVDCVIVGIVAFAQSVSLAVLMAKKHHYDIDSNKEMIGYGMGTFFGSFFSCYPIAASVSRSSVQDSAGGRTQVASLVSASLVLIVILFIGPLFENLPNCALSAIIMVALRSMFLQVLELKQLFRISPYDCAIWLVTFLCVVILHVDMGLVVGIVFAFFTVVCRSQTTKVSTLERLSEVDEYRPVSLYSKTEPNVRIRIVAYNSALYYANSEIFLKHVHRETGVKPEKMRKVLKKLMTLNDPLHSNKKKLHDSKIVEMETVTPQPEPPQAANGDTSTHGQDAMTVHRASIIGPLPNLDPRPFLYLIIDCTAFTFIDPVGIKILKQLIEDYKTVGITTYLGGVRDDVWSTMEHSGFTKTYEKCIFLTVRDAVFAAEEDKRKRLHPLPDMDGVGTELEYSPTMPLLEEEDEVVSLTSAESSNMWIKNSEA